MKEKRGFIIARKCDCCGHHELGIKDIYDDFKYIQLKPGMKIIIQESTKESKGEK